MAVNASSVSYLVAHLAAAPALPSSRPDSFNFASFSMVFYGFSWLFELFYYYDRVVYPLHIAILTHAICKCNTTYPQLKTASYSERGTNLLGLCFEIRITYSIAYFLIASNFYFLTKV